jgi:hypothetical protein
MNIAKIKGFRILGLMGVIALIGGIAVWAAHGAGTGSATTATNASASATEEAAPCGCGGPKAYYLKKYGTIKPPQLQSQSEGQPQAAPSAAGETAEPVNPASTGDGG